MPPINQPLNSVPDANIPNGVVPNVAPQTELSQEQMKANLQDMMSKIDSKYQDFNSQKFSSDNKYKVQQGEALRQLFDILQSFGVDPSNVEEVGAFLNKIKNSNPELGQQLEESLSVLLGEDVPVENTNANGEMPGASSQTGEATPENNMNINDQATPQNL